MPVSNRSSREKFLITIFCLGLFFFTLLLDTRQNQFPFFYHPDEPGKAEQVINGEWNFHHPMLLLASTSLVVKTLGVPLQPQPVTVTGRWVSAFFASVSVVALALLAWQLYGLAASVPIGIALALHHQIFELGHYFKEDTALLCGFSLVMLAIALFWRNPNWKNIAFLGFACAVAVSGKYLGGVFAILALVLLLVKKGEDGTQPSGNRLLLFFGVFLAVLAICNLPLLLDWSQFQKSFDRELSLAVKGQGDVTRSVPHAQYWSVFLDNSSPLLLLGIAIYSFIFIRSSKTRSAPEWVVFLLPFAYGLLLSFFPKTNDRYFLPASAMFAFLGVIGLWEAINAISRQRQRWWHWPAIIVIIAGFQIFTVGRFRGVATYYQAFAHDDVQEHIDFIKTHLPPNAKIAQDERVGLPYAKKAERLTIQPLLAQKVSTKKYASDFGSISEIQARGITHVAVSESAYGRYFLSSLQPKKGGEKDFAADKNFYEDLFAHHNLLFERKRGTVIYLHPGIRLYEL